MNLLRKLRVKRASILLEALLSVIILSVSIVVINQSMTASLRSLVYSEDYTKALIFLENQIFDLMYLGFIESNQSKVITLPEDERFWITVATQPVAFGQDSKINQLNLTISWKSGKRKNNMAFETYLFNPPDEKN